MEKVKLGDVCEIINGYAFKSNLYEENGIRIIRITNVQKGYIEDTEPKFYNFNLKRELNKYMLYEKDLLISLTGNVGRVGILKKEMLPAALNQRVGCIRVLNKSRLDKNYLFNVLNNKLFENECINNSKGIAQKNLSTEWLKEYKINLPSLEEQKNIANKLDKVQKIIDIRKKQIEELDKLIKSQFVEMFGELSNSKYPTVKLKTIAEVGSSHRVFTTEFVEKGIPFYRGTEIGLLANGETLKECYYISKEHYSKICDDSTKPKVGDLLLPSICNKGQIWMVDTTDPFYYKDGRVLSISPKEGKINNKYFHQFMKYKTVREYSKLGSGSTFAEFKIFILKDFDVILPPIELQNQFADIVKQIDKQKFEIQKNLEEMQKLQESLMNKYFG